MRDNIFKPLAMKDAGFYVPRISAARFSAVYYWTRRRFGVAVASPPGRPTDYAAEPACPPAAAAWSPQLTTTTASPRCSPTVAKLDRQTHPFARHSQAHDSNHLPAQPAHRPIRHRLAGMRPGLGYGYNCAVVFDPPEANLPDGKGTFYWFGAAGTWFWVDPSNDIVFIGMIQRMNGGQPNVQYLTHQLVYQALTDPSK